MHPLDGPRLKLCRARHHIGDLDAPLSAFWKTNPYEVFEEVDVKTRQSIYRVRVNNDPPPLLSAIAGDAFHNMRSALDLLIRQLVIANNKTPRKEAFPISNSETDFDPSGIGTVRGRISVDAEKVLRDLKPYKGGNDLLWGLHQLDIIDKHRLLLVVGGAWTDLILEFTVRVPGQAPVTERHSFPAIPKFPLKDGDELTRGGFTGASESETEVKIEPKFAFKVLLYEPDVSVHPGQLITTLNNFLSVTTETVELFVPLL